MRFSERLAQGGERSLGRARVAAAEFDRVDAQRGELVQRDAFWPTGRERRVFVIRRKGRVAEAAEEPHHGEIELTMTAVRSGVDQPALAAFSDQPVSGPEITVQS